MTNLSWKVRSIFNMHKVWRSWLFRNFSVTFIKSLNLSSIKPYLIVHQVAMWTLLYLVSEGFSFLVTRVWNFGKFIRHSLWRGRDLKTELKTHVAPISAQVENSSFLRFDTWKLRHLTFSTEQNFSDFFIDQNLELRFSQMNYRTLVDARAKTCSATLGQLGAKMYETFSSISFVIFQ